MPPHRRQQVGCSEHQHLLRQREVDCLEQRRRPPQLAVAYSARLRLHPRCLEQHPPRRHQLLHLGKNLDQGVVVVGAERNISFFHDGYQSFGVWAVDYLQPVRSGARRTLEMLTKIASLISDIFLARRLGYFPH